MQTKLTQWQIEKLKQAKEGIRAGLAWNSSDEGDEYWSEAVCKIDLKIEYGTSDGKPYVEPEPPIPEGWRKALDNEHCRKDVKLWDKDKKQWAKRLFPSQPFLNGDRYIVPIDPPLTDEDACVWPRLLVMVRDSSDSDWSGPYQYFGKSGDPHYPFVINGMGNVPHVWKRARRATPEEIEAANGNS